MAVSVKFRMTDWSSSHCRRKRFSRRAGLVERAEADRLSNWFATFRNKLRMEYGQAMALEGFDPDVIANVQQRVATEMLEWLEGPS